MVEDELLSLVLEGSDLIFERGAGALKGCKGIFECEEFFGDGRTLVLYCFEAGGSRFVRGTCACEVL